MPLILLLDRQLGVIRSGVKKTASLGDVMERAAAVLTRRRGAFLTSWFGRGVPIEGIDVKVSIVNSGSILERIRAVRRRQTAYAESHAGPNLMEPIAGMAGMLTGMVVGAFALILTTVTILAVSASPLLPVGAIVALALIVHGVAGVWGGWKLWSRYAESQGPRGARSSGVPAWFEMGAGAAASAAGAIAIGNDLLADRASVRDPVMRAVLTLVDRVAALVTRALGAVSLFVGLLPVITVLERAVEPLRAFVGHLVDIGTAALGSVIGVVTEAVRRSGIVALLRQLVGALPAIVELVTSQISDGIALIVAPFRAARSAAEQLWTGFVDIVTPLTTEHPTVVFFRGLGGLATALRGFGSRLRAAADRMASRLLPDSLELVAEGIGWIIDQLPESDDEPGIMDDVAAWAREASGVTAAADAHQRLQASIGDAQTVAGFGGVGATAALGPALLDAAREDLALAPIFVVGSVARIFPAERARLVERGRAVLHDDAFRAGTQVLRGAAAIAGPAIDSEVRDLLGSVERWEAPIRRRAGELPVRDVPPPRALVPHLRRVRVAAPPTDDRQAVQGWTNRVVAELRRAPVTPPVAAGAGAG